MDEVENSSTNAPPLDGSALDQSANDNESGDVSRETQDAHPDVTKSEPEPEPKDRFDALVRDRDFLRAEVTDMRKSLEEIQSKHRVEMEALQQKLDDTESKKEQAETQFQKLLERVNIIKSQLGERLKEDEVRALAHLVLTDSRSRSHKSCRRN